MAARPRPPAPKALLFDVFGTLVDWRSSIARAVESTLAPLGVDIDGGAFADAWRARYQPAMQAVRSGARPFCLLDELHRENLDLVLRATGLDALVGEAQRAQLTLAWHRLDAWPDVAEGLARLHALGLGLAPCSNGHVALMRNLAHHNGWRWDAILGAEPARAYKPDAAVYRTAVEALGLQPAEAVMVAAHSSDLAAAGALGLRTAFIARPLEFGPAGGELDPAQPTDWVATDLVDLARQLAAPAPAASP